MRSSFSINYVEKVQRLSGRPRRSGERRDVREGDRSGDDAHHRHRQRAPEISSGPLTTGDPRLTRAPAHDGDGSVPRAHRARRWRHGRSRGLWNCHGTGDARSASGDGASPRCGPCFPRGHCPLISLSSAAHRPRSNSKPLVPTQKENRWVRMRPLKVVPFF